MKKILSAFTVILVFCLMVTACSKTKNKTVNPTDPSGNPIVFEDVEEEDRSESDDIDGLTEAEKALEDKFAEEKIEGLAPFSADILLIFAKNRYNTMTISERYMYFSGLEVRVNSFYKQRFEVISNLLQEAKTDKEKVKDIQIQKSKIFDPIKAYLSATDKKILGLIKEDTDIAQETKEKLENWLKSRREILGNIESNIDAATAENIEEIATKAETLMQEFNESITDYKKLIEDSIQHLEKNQQDMITMGMEVLEKAMKDKS